MPTIVNLSPHGAIRVEDKATRERRESWEARGLSLDLARRRSVMFAVPAYRDVSPFHYASMIETVGLFGQLGIECEVRMVVGVPVTDARNALANRFLATGHSDLMFIDADEAWDPWDVVKLLATGLHFVAGVGRKKTTAPDDRLDTWCMTLLGRDGTVPITESGMVEVDAVGTGFMLVNRSVLAQMAAAHPEWERQTLDEAPQTFTEFFACDLSADGKQRHGEDISFCHRWRALGGRIFVDPTICIRHYGSFAYEGSPARFFEHPLIPAEAGAP